MTIVPFFVVNCALPSATFTLIEKFPEAVGVPLTLPVVALMVSPVGNPVADHENGDCPPMTVNVLS